MNKDLKFLIEMKKHWGTSNTDFAKHQTLGKMIEDWIDELQAIRVQAAVIKKNADGLLPCPFCGETKINLWMYKDFWKIQCDNSECASLMEDFPFKETAIDTWNKRV